MSVLAMRRPTHDRAATAATRGAAAALDGRWDEAVVLFEEALCHGPHFPHVRQALATSFMGAGRIPEAIAEYRRALVGDPKLTKARENLIFCLDMDPATTSRTALVERRTWWKMHGAPLAREIRPYVNDRARDRALRVGYVSADFRQHSASNVFGGVVLRHSPAVEPFCYSSTERTLHDFITRSFQERTTWRDIDGQSDRDVAELIRRDGIDILVDLSGYSAGHRLGVFCRKPAPVQVTAWGHALGTGLDTVDYFFADVFTVPAARRADFSETVIDLPCVLAYTPMPYTPDVALLPSRAGDRPFTFGAPSRAMKLSPATLSLWADALRAVPGSRLFLKDVAYNTRSVSERIVRELAARGVDGDRVYFAGKTPHDVHLAAFGEIDLVLDPFPHGGGVTTAESLLMGVPVVTLLGERVIARLSAAQLRLVGAEEFIASTPAEYVAIAQRWAAPEARRALAWLRAQLRPRILRSPICARTYVDAVEAAYRDIWQRWCSKGDRS